MNTNRFLVAGIVNPPMWHWEDEKKEMPNIWIQCGRGGPVFYTEASAVERAKHLNKTTDKHGIRNAQVIELRRDDYCPY